MGCCISTNESGEEKLASPKHQHLSERALVPELDSSCVRRANGKAPPPAPPPVEEETVKEVLSETPKPKLLPFPKIHNEKIRKPSLLDLEEESVEKKAPSNAVEDASEMSEICSVSESLSTTTMTERKDDEERSRDDGEVRQRVDRSPGKVPKKRFASGDLAGRTDKGGRSPVRRFEPSPGRRTDNAIRSVHSKEMNHATRRRISGNNGLKQDPGDSSGRRSRSPATRPVESGAARSTIGRSPSSRRPGMSPGRVPPLPQEPDQKLEETKDGNWQTNESLENPHVSCNEIGDKMKRSHQRRPFRPERKCGSLSTGISS